jgi:hypothetical protein
MVIRQLLRDVVVARDRDEARVLARELGRRDAAAVAELEPLDRSLELSHLHPLLRAELAHHRREVRVQRRRREPGVLLVDVERDVNESQLLALLAKVTPTSHRRRAPQHER